MRKTLILPNGATVEIVPPSNFILLQSGPPPRSLKLAEGEPEREWTEPEMRWLVQNQKLLFTRCVGPLRFPDGRVVSLVDAPWPMTKPSELSIEELDQASADVLAAEINKLREEAASAAATFQPGTPKPAQGPADSGPTVAPVSVPAQ